MCSSCPGIKPKTNQVNTSHQTVDWTCSELGNSMLNHCSTDIPYSILPLYQRHLSSLVFLLHNCYFLVRSFWCSYICPQLFNCTIKCLLFQEPKKKKKTVDIIKNKDSLPKHFVWQKQKNRSTNINQSTVKQTQERECQQKSTETRFPDC